MWLVVRAARAHAGAHRLPLQHALQRLAVLARVQFHNLQLRRAHPCGGQHLGGGGPWQGGAMWSDI